MDALSNIRRPVAADLERYRLRFIEALQHDDDYLGQALAYVGQRTGKMMRPLLLLLIAREYGEVGEDALRAAVMLELLHTASLLHDDVVDESDLRRGCPSLNAQYGAKVAVLVGDYLLSHCLSIGERISDGRAVGIVARLGGTLSEGEVRQLANIRAEVSTEEAYYDIIRSKTAALFSACARLGALVAGATQQEEEAAADFGQRVGICFQIRDDIFDYFPSPEIGKPTGNDMAEGKLTLPVIYALTTTRDEGVRALAAAVKRGEASREEIAQLVEFTKAAGGIDYARTAMLAHRDEAATYLATLRNEQVREALAGYLDYVVGRTL